MATLCAVGSVIYNGQSLAAIEIKITVLDSALIYAMGGLKAMALPLLIAYINMHCFKYDFKYSYLLRSKGRLSIWYKYVINIVADSIIVTALMMLAGAVTGYIVCDNTVDFFSVTSVCFNEFKKYGMSVPVDLNIPLMIIETYVINAGELIARALTAFLIYWFTNSRVISVIGMNALSYMSLGCLGVSGIAWRFKPGAVYPRYYSAMYFSSQVMETLALLAVAIMLVLLTAQIFVPAKEFLKE